MLDTKKRVDCIGQLMFSLILCTSPALVCVTNKYISHIPLLMNSLDVIDQWEVLGRNKQTKEEACLFLPPSLSLVASLKQVHLPYDFSSCPEVYCTIFYY